MEKHLWEGEVSKELEPGELPDSDHRWNACGIPAPASDGDGDFDAHMHTDSRQSAGFLLAGVSGDGGSFSLSDGLLSHVYRVLIV